MSKWRRFLQQEKEIHAQMRWACEQAEIVVSAMPLAELADMILVHVPTPRGGEEGG